MTTELTIFQPQAILAEKQEWSRAMAPSGLLPKQYQGNPANLLFAVEYAAALGVERIHAITAIHVIEGRPSASADLIAATVRRAGHKLRVIGDDTYAEAMLIRADDPEFTYTARWDMDKARQARLAGKGVWKDYPGAMLRSRAITEVARMGASDALFGVQYTPEELGAETDSSGAPIRSQPISALREPASGAARMGAILAKPEQVVPPAAVDEPGPAPLLDPRGALARRMFATFREANIADRDARLAFIGATIGRAVESSAQMTDDDARVVIDALATVPAGVDPATGEVDSAGEPQWEDPPAVEWPQAEAVGR